jgi:hypothetical protein
VNEEPDLQLTNDLLLQRVLKKLNSLVAVQECDARNDEERYYSWSINKKEKVGYAIQLFNLFNQSTKGFEKVAFSYVFVYHKKVHPATQRAFYYF